MGKQSWIMLFNLLGFWGTGVPLGALSLLPTCLDPRSPQHGAAARPSHL